LEGLCDGVAHALSLFRSLKLIASASARRFGTGLSDPKAIGQALGAELLAGASVAMAQGRIRVRWRLIQAEDGAILASSECKGAADDVWALQEDAAAQIAARIEPAALEAAFKKVVARPTASQTAYGFFLQGVHAAFGTDRSDFAAGLEFFKAALEADPDFVPAAAMAPWAAAYGNLISSAQELRAYAQMARHAARRASDDARSLALAATAIFYLEQDFAYADRAAERALALNPNEYLAWTCGAWISLHMGRFDEALARFDQAEALNPLGVGRDAIHPGRALCCFLQGRLDEAEAHIGLAFATQPDNPSAQTTGLAIAARRGDELARKTRLDALLRRFPEGLAAPALRVLSFALPEHRNAFFSALREAGIPG
jgi:adenylate cyclase